MWVGGFVWEVEGVGVWVDMGGYGWMGIQVCVREEVLSHTRLSLRET